MNDDELKKLWQEQPLRESVPSPAELLLAMQSKTTRLRRILDMRDLRELVACVVVIFVFGWQYFTVYRTPVSRFGVWVIIGSALFIAWKLIHTRRANPPVSPGATTVESLQAELKTVRAQSRLLESVLWWYVLPLTVGGLIVIWGQEIDPSIKILFTLSAIPFAAAICWLNQWARSKQLVPVETQLVSLLRSAETGEPLEEAHVANLRPLVLSLATADKVKPVEFKVAFWQLALFGEIGFMGSWFFLMLGLTWRLPKIESFVRELFSPLHLALIVPFFLAGLVYSWLIQKTTERAVGISTLGIHLLKGQDFFTWDEIKEVRPFKFLHIQNLWLIKESGEKTIMHWTPLERHADLKAAVERFAPLDHPIRNFLSLLKA